MTTIIALYLFALGLTFGSFALVVADRTIRKKDWVKGRSTCDFCHKKLSPVDLVPLFSWISTAGKCRYCNKKLSVMYPAVELSLGLAFTGSYLALQSSLYGTMSVVQLGLWLAGLVLMTVLLIIDAKTMILPYKFIFPLIGIATSYAVIELLNNPNVTSGLVSLLASVAVSAGIFAVLFAVSRGKWIGDSDVLLGIAMGMYLGKPIEAWLAIIIACLAGFVYAALFAVTKKRPIRHAKIPFGPFLIIGLYITFLFGAQIVSWYTESILFL